LFVAKFDSNGQCPWAKQSNGYATPHTFYTDLKGNVYVGGEFYSVAFENTTLSSTGSRNGFIVKYDSLGTLQWVQNIGTNVAQYGTEEIHHITADSLGNVYASGIYDQDLTLCGNYLPSYNTYFPKGFVASFDANGNCLSAQNGNYWTDFIRGERYERGFVNNAGVYNGVYLTPGFYVMRCDVVGNGQWAYQVNGNNFWPWCEIDVFKNELYVTGSIKDTLDFGGITGIFDNEMFAAKIDCSALASGVISPDIYSDLKVYPNPASGNFYIESSNEGKMKITLRNMLGQTVNVQTCGGGKAVIEAASVQPGVYYAEIVQGSTKTVRKIVLN
jgi:hypothetical protein